MRPGQIITVEAFGGEKLRRVVVEVSDNTVVICKQDEWDAALKENRDPVGVGFPLRAVKAEK